MPEYYQNKLGLKEIIYQHRIYFGLLLLFSFILLVVEITIWLVPKSSNEYKKRKQKKIFFNRLRSLSKEEKNILEECLAKNNRALLEISLILRP
ncbi:super-infection exclusion protein B [Legionella pneumophila]|uniref:super-infection exclusion protein B n=1 Tax=Legionella pneumophila TaxID=446 RepID=UPI00077B19C6